MTDNDIPFEFFLELVQAIAAIKPKTSFPCRRKPSPHSSNVSSVRIFTNWARELCRHHGTPLSPGTTSNIFRLLFPEADIARKYGMQEVKLSRYLARVLNVSTDRGGRGRGLVEWMSEDNESNIDARPRAGCLGIEVARIMKDERGSQNASFTDQPLTIGTVDTLLTALARNCAFSSPSVLNSDPHMPHNIPSTPQAILHMLFTHPALSPFGAATLTQIILKDLRPLLYPLPDDAAAHYTAALLGWKSNAVEILTIAQAVKAWETVMGWVGLAKAWKVKGWVALEAFERGRSEGAEIYGAIAEDCESSPEDEEDDFEDEEDRAEGYVNASRTALPTIGLPVAIPKSVKATSCAHAMRSMNRHCNSAAVGSIWAETKYDGERAQIHVQRVPLGEGLEGGSWKITIYSKSGRDSTYDRAGVHKVILDALGLCAANNAEGSKIRSSVIFDAEMVAYSTVLRRIDEFWRIRTLIASTAVGPRHRTRRPRRVYDQQLPPDSPDTDSQRTDSDPHEPEITSSQASMASDTSADGTRHLSLVFFDILHIDGVSLVNEPYRVRRETLERVVKVREGWAMLSERTRVGRAGSSAEMLRRAMAACIADHEEGLVLKAEEGRYGDWKVPWIKLKKDYIPGYGDCVDLVLLGAGWDKDRGRELRVGPAVYTTFYIGALVDKDAARQSYEKPHFEILFTVAYGLSREKLEELNFSVRNSGEGCVKCAGSKHPLSVLPYTYNMYDGISRPGPVIMLKTPLLAEVMGANFTKAPHSKFYTLRFPRIEKVHRPSERSWSDGVSLREMQRIARMAVGRDRPGKAEEDWCTELWGGIASPGVRAPERRREMAEAWIDKLERADGVSGQVEDVDKRQKRKREGWNELGVRDKDADTENERRVRQRKDRVSEFIEGSSKDVSKLREQGRGPKERDNDIGQQSTALPKTPPALRALGSVTNVFPTSPTSIKCTTTAILPTPPTERPVLPKKRVAAPTAPPERDIVTDQDVTIAVCGEGDPAPASTRNQTPLTPPSTASSDDLRNAPSAIPSTLLRHAQTPLGALLARAVVWVARPSGTTRLSWHIPASDIVPPGNQVHALDALLFACGWSGASICPWAERGVVFVDDTHIAFSPDIWMDTRFPLRVLMERRKALLADAARCAQSKPIWVFSIKMLSFDQIEGLAHSDIKRRAICRLG